MYSQAKINASEKKRNIVADALFFKHVVVTIFDRTLVNCAIFVEKS